MFKQSDVKDILPMTPTQEGMLFHCLMDNDSGVYIEQAAFKFQGEINLELFEKCFNMLIDKYDILRTVFIYKKVKIPQQVILEKREAKIHFEDISYLDTEARNRYIDQFKKADRKRGFDLSKDIMMRISLIKESLNIYNIIWSFHDIIMDGWCLGILSSDLFKIYDSIRKGKPVRTDSPVPFSHYFKWLKKQDKQEGLKFWQNYLKGYETPCTLPKCSKSFNQMGNNKYEAAGHNFSLSEGQTRRLMDMAKKNQVTENTIFQSLWGLLLHKYNNRDDVVFGAVVSGRPSEIPGIEKIVGVFINTIPVRINAKAISSFPQLIQDVQRKALLTKSYEYLSLADIQANSPLKGNLIDHIMIFENFPIQRNVNIASGGMSFFLKNVEKIEHTNYDFNFIAAPGNRYLIKFSFNGQVYDRDFIKNMELHFKEVVTQVLNEPDIDLKDTFIVPPLEREKLLFDFNQTAAEFPKDKTIHELFEDKVKRMSHHAAVMFRDKNLKHNSEISYKELDEKANGIAASLKLKGAKKEVIVGVMVEPCLEIVSLLLGILKAGGAYLPIDISTPEKRVRYMLKDCHAKVLLTYKEFKERYHDICEVIDISVASSSGSESGSKSPVKVNKSTDLAYLIFTSGSTGKPKGVMIEHYSVVNILLNLFKDYPLNRPDAYLFRTSYTFDVSVTELFGWYLGGGRLAVMDETSRKEPQKVLEIIEEIQVSHINFVPSLFYALVNVLNDRNIGKLNSLKYVFLAGEAVMAEPVEKLKMLNPRIECVNLYGPTEAAIYASGYSFKHWQGEGLVPIGKPLNNVALFVLNHYDGLQPIRIPGQLAISGVGVGRGYLNNQELTFETFTPDPFPGGEYLYKTGDLAYYLPDGNIIFLGREDRQVKMRGFRIELEEIESVLMNYEGVKEAVVTDNKDKNGDQYLCAYYVPKTQEPSTRDNSGPVDNHLEISELRNHLGKVLPYYMIPSRFVEVGEIPLTTNGKVDRLALPSYDSIHVKTEYEPPQNSTEEKLIEIWSDTLAIAREKIGVNANFFELGGHSLKAIYLTSRIHKELNVRLRMSEIFNVSTIKEQSRLIVNTKKDMFTPIKPVKEKEFYAVSSAQKRVYFVQQIDLTNLGYNMPIVRILEGDIDIKRMEETFKRLIKRHEVLRTSFELIDEEPVQKIHHHVNFSIGYSEIENEKFDIKKILQRFIRTFDLSQAPLFRVNIIRIKERRYLFIIDIHHIISDGTSLNIFIKDFMMFYAGEYLPELNIQFKDFTEWQNFEKNKETMKEQERYWLEIFEVAAPVLDLATDYPRPEMLSFEGSHISFEIEKETTKTLKNIALRENVTLFIILLSVYNITLSKLSRQNDIIIGTGVSGRRHEDIRDTMGMFINMLALRNYPEENKTFREFLKEVRKRSLEAFENQDYPFEELVSKLGIKRDSTRNPLFDVVLEFQNISIQPAKIKKVNISNVKILPLDFDHRATPFDLILEGVEAEGKLSFVFTYNIKLFKKDTIKRFIRYFKEIVKAISDKEDIQLKDIYLYHGLLPTNQKILQQDQGDFNF